ncbi:mCpol domain-containing protein, partial [Gemmobacter serpentinus]|uniref:mCpol domain-containing protein n=1 Tax=Gemmobacter serpentinus TaxID=2652247 RepID=UPI00124BF4B5
KRAPRSLQHHVLYRKYNGQDSEISALLGKCGIESIGGSEISFSVGVGKSLRESYVALLYAKSTGKARVCDFNSIGKDV